MHEEREARLVHRIESFSDLVMGFSLALLSLTLVVPMHAAELFAHTWWIFAYFWTFAYIAGIWYNHQRLFERYFVPNPVSIVVNFVLLSMLGLVVYFVQVFGRMHSDEDRALAFIGYFLAFGVSLTAMGTLYAVGTAARWANLDEHAREFGVGRAGRSLTVGLALVGAVLTLYLRGEKFGMNSMFSLAIVAVCAGLLVRLALRLHPVKRWRRA